MAGLNTPTKYNRLHRFKTEHKSTENSQRFANPELQEVIRELNRRVLPREIFPTILSRVLYQLALSPVDLLPVTREDVEKASVQQTRQLLKEDIDFYLDSKCEKLELRRQGLLAEVARVLFKSEKLHTLTGNFLSAASEHHPSNRHSNRYERPTEDGTSMRRNEERRLRVLKKMRIKERSESDMRLQLKDELTRKFSEAENRRHQYRSYVESLRGSPILSPEAHQRKLRRAQQTQQERTEQLREQLMSKLDRATHSRESRRKRLEEELHRTNERKQLKSRIIKQNLELADFEVREQIKEQLEEDMEVHLKKKELLVDRNRKDLKSRHYQEQRKVEAIRVELQRRQDEQQERSAQLLRIRHMEAEEKREQQRVKMQQQLRQRQSQKNDQIEQIYRRKSLADMKHERRRSQLLKYRLETQVLVSSRKKSLEIEARRNHILEHIKMEISSLNVQRHRKIQQLKVERVKEELNIVEQRHRLLEDRRNSMAGNRQHLRMLFLRRKHNLDEYFSCRTKNFTSKLSQSLDANQTRKPQPTASPAGETSELLTLQPTVDPPRKNDLQ